MNERYAAFVRRRWAIDPEREPAAAVGHAFAMLVAEYHECGAECGGWDGQALLDELGDCCWALTALCIALDVAMPTVAGARAAPEVTPEWLWLGQLADAVQHWYQEGPPAADDVQLADALVAALRWILASAADEGWTLDDVLAANVVKLQRRYPAGFDVAASRGRAGA